MTAAELRAWQRRCGLRTDAQAAAALGISPVTYRRKRKGLAKVTRQTELLCAYYEVFSLRVSATFDALHRLHRLTSIPVMPATVEKSAALIEKLIDETISRR